MDIIAFVTQLMNCLKTIEAVQSVTSQAEGPTVRGRAYFQEYLFLAFYYNQSSETQAFALVRNGQRIWGIDYDTIRGWHEHPLNLPDQHVKIVSQSVSDVIQQLREILSRI